MRRRDAWPLVPVLVLALLSGALALLVSLSPAGPAAAQGGTGTITIVKETSYPDGSNFTFTAGSLGSFTLDDANPDDGDAITDTETFDFVGPGTYKIEELATSPWVLDAITCDSGSYTVTTTGVEIDLVTGDDITCIFYNSFTGNAGPVDLTADAIEVTQSLQDLNNSVRLVRDKPTYVRFHASSSNGTWATTARLTITHPILGPTVVLPINGTKQFGSHLDVLESPDRGEISHAFLFEVPSNYLDTSTLGFFAEVNPAVAPTGRDPVETTYTNNDMAIDVTLEDIPPLHVTTYRIQYPDFNAGTVRVVDTAQPAQMIEWMEDAYPTPSIVDNLRTSGLLFTFNFGGVVSPPPCGTVNSWLTTQWWLNLLGGTWLPGERYYGMVTDEGGFIRGCAPLNWFVASGPTGTGTFGWDEDGSYGDWYGAHEIGHSYGRNHANFCGATGPGVYPYPGGSISPVTTGNNAQYGFRAVDGGWEVYDPATYVDVMSYCAFQWLGSFTHLGLMSYFVTNPVALLAPEPAARQDRLLVVGLIHPQPITGTLRAELRPLLVFPDVEPVKQRVPGQYAIVLRNKDGKALATYRFTPREQHYGPPHPEDPNPEEDEPPMLFDELVPYVQGTARVEIRGPENVLLGLVEAGPATPSVAFQPSGGVVVQAATDDVALRWSASDADGDELRFYVQFSADDGQTWRTVASDLTERQVTIARDRLSATRRGRFRVLATDGIHTATAVSPQRELPNQPPQAQILRPAAPRRAMAGQTLGFRGRGYDPDSGRMTGAQLTWRSTLDGVLGHGRYLAVSTLSVGDHTITLRADDGQGGVAEDSVRVRVLMRRAGLPPGEPLFIPVLQR